MKAPAASLASCFLLLAGRLPSFMSGRLTWDHPHLSHWHDKCGNDLTSTKVKKTALESQPCFPKLALPRKAASLLTSVTVSHIFRSNQKCFLNTVARGGAVCTSCRCSPVLPENCLAGAQNIQHFCQTAEEQSSWGPEAIPGNKSQG